MILSENLSILLRIILKTNVICFIKTKMMSGLFLFTRQCNTPESRHSFHVHVPHVPPPYPQITSSSSPSTFSSPHYTSSHPHNPHRSHTAQILNKRYPNIPHSNTFGNLHSLRLLSNLLVGHHLHTIEHIESLDRNNRNIDQHRKGNLR